MSEAPHPQETGLIPAPDPGALPPVRGDVAERALEELMAAWAERAIEPPADSHWQARARLAFAASDFMVRMAQSSPATVRDWLSGGAETARDANSYRAALDAVLGDDPDHAPLGAELRRFRAVESARLAWRDVFGLASIDVLLEEQSALAEACLGTALDRLEAAARVRHGTPRDEAGNALSLVVLGMGKLGGGELNFSSDIDLIFLYGEAGETDGDRPLDNHAFFTRLGQELIRTLDERTVDGFVYRVDMRLRPFGSSGPLVMHLGQLEEYLLTQAREWERFALVKARPLTGDPQTLDELAALLRPFVFRRYLDFGAFEALRDLKARLEREVARKGIEGNVKYGRGGIREIEFIAQAFQLIRGGREPALRTRSLLQALEALAENGDLSSRVVGQLMAAYRYLRRVENRLQLFDDAREHALPRSADGRARLAWIMGERDWEGFSRTLDDHMRTVYARFRQVFNVPSDEDDSERDPLAVAWEDGADTEALASRLRRIGYDEPDDVAQRLHALRDSALYRVLTSTARNRLDRVLPLLLADTATSPAPSRTVVRLLRLLEAVARRSVYLSLLAEHADARRRLIDLFGASPWIAELVTQHPILLDELLDPDSLYEAPARELIEAEVEAALADIADDDLEAQMDALRRIRQVNVLRVAAVDITGRLPLMQVSDHLTRIAEVILAAVHRLAWRQMVARHGRPTARIDGDVRHPGLGIVAYGKLGGLELGYGSDLDIVFLHDGDGEQATTDGTDRPLDNGAFFGRLAQRMVHMLNTPTPAGILYEIDTRLRPNGSSGLLVSPLGAFERYQHEDAWTWEHQALTRARMVVGEPELKANFERIRREVLTRPRDSKRLLADVVSMRERMRRELAREGGGRFDLKQGRGGVADIEFMVQYAVLSQASGTPALVEYTDNIRQIETLAREELLEPETAELLADAYRAYRARIHRLALLGEPAIVEPDAEMVRYRESVAALWHARMGSAGQADAESGH